jgi:hypothetical protein
MQIVELRVHGVSGTPAADVLGDPHPRRVAGDDASGFWRRASDGERKFVQEAYEWGGLTSGSPLRAVWVLLAPFAIVNAAVAMTRPREHVAAALTRLFALSLTITLVGAVFIFSADLLAWQCGNDPECVNRRSWTKFLGWAWLAAPGRRLAFSVLLPVVVVLVLWWLARATWQRAEAWTAAAESDVRAAQEAAPLPSETPFDDPDLWDGRERGEYLRHLHVAAAVGNVAALLSYALVGLTGHGAVFFAMAIVVLAATALLALPDVQARVPAWRNRLGVAVLVAAWTVLALAVAYGWTEPSLDGPAPQQLPGIDPAVTYLFVAQLLALLVLLFVSWWPPAALGVVALTIGAAFSAGVIVQGADFLAPDAEAITLPVGVVWAARGIVALLALVTVVLIVAALVWLRHRLRGRRERAPVRRAERLARLTDRVPLFTVGAMALIVPVLVAGAGIVVAIDRGWADTLQDASEGVSWHGWTVFGSRVIGLFAIGLMILARQSYSNRTMRRRVGIVWDIATFWPRRVHPLAPACYAERAVPELAGRVAELGGREAVRPVVMSAHSQGSVIAVAALLRHRRAFDNVALVTYGSPLDRFYLRFFPAYFPPATTLELDRRLHRHWLNLVRTTDPIGGGVAAVGDAANWVVVPLDPQHPEAHSNYTREPYYRDALTQADTWLTGRTYA